MESHEELLQRLLTGIHAQIRKRNVLAVKLKELVRKETTYQRQVREILGQERVQLPQAPPGLRVPDHRVSYRTCKTTEHEQLNTLRLKSNVICAAATELRLKIREEWERNFKPSFEPYAKAVCRENAEKLWNGLIKLPQELRDLILPQLRDFSWDETRAKVLVKGDNTNMLDYETQAQRVTLLRKGYGSFWNIAPEQLYYYEDPEYVGPDIAREMATWYYQLEFFDLGSNRCLLGRFLSEDRFGYGINPAAFVKRISLCIELSEKKGVPGVFPPSGLQPLLTIESACLIELTLIVDKGCLGLKQLRDSFSTLIPLAQNLRDNNQRLRLQICDYGQGPWRLYERSELPLAWTLSLVEEWSKKATASGITYGLELLDPLNEGNPLPLPAGRTWPLID